MEVIILNCDAPNRASELFAVLSKCNNLGDFIYSAVKMDLEEFTVWCGKNSYFLVANGALISDFETKAQELTRNYGDMLYDDDTMIRFNVSDKILTVFIGDPSLTLDKEFEIPKQVEQFYVTF